MKYWGNIITYMPPRISGDRPHAPPPLNFPVMPAGLPVEVIAKVPSRYYQVPRYYFTVLTVAHNRWYRPTLVCIALF